jgi:ferredoxin
MPPEAHRPAVPSLLDRARLDDLIGALRRQGHQVLGPKVADGAIVLEPVAAAADLPAGWTDAQDGGSYRLSRTDGPALFDHVVGPQSWKRFLYPPRQRLWRAERRDDGFRVVDEAAAERPPRYALLGVRACEIAALRIHDKVFDNGSFADTGYLARRRAAFVVAVNCGRAGGTCFCASMGTGPKADGGFDIALTELLDGGHRFVAEAGSEKGAKLLAGLGLPAASRTDVDAAAARVAAAGRAMGRRMAADAGRALVRNPEHPRWDEVAKRCLNCANCTLVCPTCFCSTMEDTTDLTGDHAERWRTWDSCFTVDFSYIHGGPVRREARARYRQWITHKLGTWHDQFGSSGCVGCGRCITWCPVGIDITEEARAIRAGEGEGRA